MQARREIFAVLLAASVAVTAGAGCSFRRFAVNKLGDALAEAGTTYASDEDPELIRDALPFTLKLIESLLDQSPRHLGLLTAAASGFTQYAYAFVQMDADEVEDQDLGRSTEMRMRARRLYLRAHQYGVRALEEAHPGFTRAMLSDSASALKQLGPDDVPLLYWTAASLGLAITLSKDDPDRLADLPLVEAFARRALELDEDYDAGALHELMISFEGSRPVAMGGSVERARRHFERALALSGRKRASPFVTFAETVCVREQDRALFVHALTDAIGIDPEAQPEWRLQNLVMQRRARWLLKRADALFAE